MQKRAPAPPTRKSASPVASSPSSFLSRKIPSSLIILSAEYSVEPSSPAIETSTAWNRLVVRALGPDLMLLVYNPASPEDAERVASLMQRG